MCFGASHAIGIPDFFCPFFVGCVSFHSLAPVRGASPEVKAILDGFWFQSTPPRGGRHHIPNPYSHPVASSEPLVTCLSTVWLSQRRYLGGDIAATGFGTGRPRHRLHDPCHLYDMGLSSSQREEVMRSPHPSLKLPLFGVPPVSLQQFLWACILLLPLLKERDMVQEEIQESSSSSSPAPKKKKGFLKMFLIVFVTARPGQRRRGITFMITCPWRSTATKEPQENKRKWSNQRQK